MKRRQRFWVLGALGLLAALGRPAAAQLTCEVNGIATCATTASASSAINITVTSAARVTVSSSTVTLPQPNETSYNTGFGGAGSVQFEVRSNAAWTVSISSSSTLWTGTPLTAWQNKPRSDLQWATAVGGPYTDMTGTNASLATGTATNSTIQTLFLRSKYSWATDRPGTYSIQLQVTLTAP